VDDPVEPPVASIHIVDERVERRQVANVQDAVLDARAGLPERSEIRSYLTFSLQPLALGIDVGRCSQRRIRREQATKGVAISRAFGTGVLASRRKRRPAYHDVVR
jgi:hypothetical protein